MHGWQLISLVSIMLAAIDSFRVPTGVIACIYIYIYIASIRWPKCSCSVQLLSSNLATKFPGLESRCGGWPWHEHAWQRALSITAPHAPIALQAENSVSLNITPRALVKAFSYKIHKVHTLRQYVCVLCRSGMLSKTPSIPADPLAVMGQVLPLICLVCDFPIIIFQLHSPLVCAPCEPNLKV